MAPSYTKTEQMTVTLATTALTELPTVIADSASDIGCHRFISTASLHLVICAFPLPTPTALELISCCLRCSSTLTVKQSFLFDFLNLLLPLLTSHFSCAHVDQPLRLKNSKENFSPEIWVVLILQVKN